MGALPDLPPFYSVRYGLILLSPLSVIAGLSLAQFLPALTLRQRWYLAPLGALLAVSSWCNLALAVEYRDSLGSLTRAVEAAYSYVETRNDAAPLLLLPGFLDFDYRPDSTLIGRKRRVDSLAEAEGAAALRPWALGWEPVFLEQFGLVRVFDGCQGFALGDCRMRAYLHRIPETPETPSLQSRFSGGLAAAEAGDTRKFLSIFEALAADAPSVQVRYNYALALHQSRRYDEAVRLWKGLVHEGVVDRGTLLNALETARAASDRSFELEVESLLESR
jgi:hypothetical protein